MKKPVPVIGLAGYSGSGKTTFLEKLISELKSRGYKIGVIKHTHHAVEFDQPGKDTWRHAKAGADFVALSAPGGYSVFKKTDGDPGPEILISMAGKLDLIIIEGYKKGKWPKIEVFYQHSTAERFVIPDEELLAVVSDALPVKAVPHFGLEDVEGVTEFIEQAVLKKGVLQMSEIKQEVLDAVKKAAKDGRLTCTEARKLAEVFKVEPGIVGEAADELKIRIKSCELGCF